MCQLQPFNVIDATITTIHTAMLSGKLTCRSLVEAYIRRIEAYDRQGPALNAIIKLNPQALEIAGQLDNRLKQSGLSGPLHGIPVLLKDNIGTADMPTTGGSACLTDFTPVDDAFISRKLKQAGALILAKVNLHELAIWGETASSVLGQTLNPYDLTRTPGGSSGGTGAAVAAGFAPVGIGTDTVNSIRSPASANCLVGFRPTVGLVSRSGIIPYSMTQDTAGPITLTVRDTATLLDVIAGYDDKDEITAQSNGHQPCTYLDYLDTNGLHGKRIGLLHSFCGTKPEHTAVNEVIQTSLDLIRAGGAAVIDLVEPLDSAELVSEVSVHLYDLNDDLNGYLQSTQPPPPVDSLAAILRSGKYHLGIEANIHTALTLSKASSAYRERLLKQERLRNHLLKLMTKHTLDCLVYPHQKRLVVPIGETQVERNGVLAAVTGFPAITVPAGFSPPTKDAPLGIPVGIEFLAKPWQEPLLLTIAYSFEQACPVRKPPICTPALD